MKTMAILQFSALILSILAIEENYAVTFPKKLYSVINAESLTGNLEKLREIENKFIIKFLENDEPKWPLLRSVPAHGYSSIMIPLCHLVWNSPVQPGLWKFCKAKSFLTDGPGVRYEVTFSQAPQKGNLPYDFVKCECWYHLDVDTNPVVFSPVTFFTTWNTQKEFFKLIEVPYIPNQLVLIDLLVDTVTSEPCSSSAVPVR